MHEVYFHIASQNRPSKTCDFQSTATLLSPTQNMKRGWENTNTNQTRQNKYVFSLSHPAALFSVQPLVSKCPTGDSSRSQNAPDDSHGSITGRHLWGNNRTLSSGPLAGRQHHRAVHNRRRVAHLRQSLRVESQPAVSPARRYNTCQSVVLHLQVPVEDEDLFRADATAAWHGASDRLSPVVYVNQLVTGRSVEDRGATRSVTVYRYTPVTRYKYRGREQGLL